MLREGRGDSIGFDRVAVRLRDKAMDGERVSFLKALSKKC